MSSMEEFECLVIGDEPAGLWFLEKYYSSTNGQLRLGWLSAGRNPRNVLIPTPVAQHFGMPFHSSWNADIRFPREAYPWNETEISKRFPEVQVKAIRALFFENPGAAYAKLTSLIRIYPSLIALGQAFWKVGGRAKTASPETQLMSALLSTELCYWDPTTTLSEPVKRLMLPETEHPIEDIKPTRTGLQISLRGGTSYQTKKLILNLTLFDLHRVFGEGLGTKMWHTLDPELKAVTATYDLTVKVKREAVPWSISPLTLMFDENEIPEPMTEIWPMWCEAGESVVTLKTGVTLSRETSLEAIESQFRKKMAALNRIFPFLAKAMVSVDTPLDSDICASPEARQGFSRELSFQATEFYNLSALNFRTASPSIFMLGSYCRCHLPYPIGGLTAAGEILIELLRARKKPRSGLMDGSERVNVSPN